MSKSIVFIKEKKGQIQSFLDLLTGKSVSDASGSQHTENKNKKNKY